MLMGLLDFVQIAQLNGLDKTYNVSVEWEHKNEGVAPQIQHTSVFFEDIQRKRVLMSFSLDFVLHGIRMYFSDFISVFVFEIIFK